MAVIAVALREKCAVAAILAFNKSDVGIGANLLPGFGQNANERIVGSVKDESRHCDTIDDVARSSAFVVIVRSGKTAVVSRNLVIEIAQRRDAP